MSEINSEAKLSAKIKLKRLENQLILGYKVVHISTSKIGTEPLTDEERDEIKKEIEDLKKQL